MELVAVSVAFLLARLDRDELHLFLLLLVLLKCTCELARPARSQGSTPTAVGKQAKEYACRATARKENVRALRALFPLLLPPRHMWPKKSRVFFTSGFS